jgi:hypothetical protein
MCKDSYIILLTSLCCSVKAFFFGGGGGIRVEISAVFLLARQSVTLQLEAGLQPSFVLLIFQMGLAFCQGQLWTVILPTMPHM